MSAVEVATIIHAAYVVPVEQPGSLKNHSVVIGKDGAIVGIFATGSAELAKFNADEEVDLATVPHIIMPGLVNTHTHTPMALMRGISPDVPLKEWLEQYIWPVEGKHVSAEFVRDGSRLAVAEMLRGGTTLFNDMYFFPEAAGQVVEETGIRAVLGLVVLSFPTPYCAAGPEYIEKGKAAHEKLTAMSSRITTAWAPHAPYTVSAELLAQINGLSNEMGVPVHIHMHETQAEVDAAVAEIGKTHLVAMGEAGILSNRMIAAHMTSLTDAELELVASKGVNVCTCTQSNCKLASGLARISDMLDKGVNVAIGTDGCSSNNSLDMFEEMKVCSLVAKVKSGNASAVNPQKAVEMATLNGARALGLGDVTGSLSAGKRADIISVCVERVDAVPMYDPLSHLVYSCNRDSVDNVWVDGARVMKDGALTTVDEKAVIAMAREWRAKLAPDAAV